MDNELTNRSYMQPCETHGLADHGYPDLHRNNTLLKVGVYGWRKTLLYLLLSILTISVVVNSILLIWIILLFYPNFPRPGPMRFQDKGVEINGHMIIDGSLFANEIRSNQEGSLNFHAEKQITFNITGTQSKRSSFKSASSSLKSGLTINGADLIFSGRKVYIRDEKERTVLSIDDRRITVHRGKVYFDSEPMVASHIKTNLIESLNKSGLSIVSRYNSQFNIVVPKQLYFTKSQRFNVSASKCVSIKSDDVVFAVNSVQFPNIPQVKNAHSNIASSLCICKNGKLFSAKDCEDSHEIC
ncbi:hypothetical protein GJ496_008397 [Pomphorhynchus laevis]|nr:hypothetical protein GJ496_008397 [Pomphorhynchus laevis]